jgi:hypothetical protein
LGFLKEFIQEEGSLLYETIKARPQEYVCREYRKDTQSNFLLDCKSTNSHYDCDNQKTHLSVSVSLNFCNSVSLRHTKNEQEHAGLIATMD